MPNLIDRDKLIADLCCMFDFALDSDRLSDAELLNSVIGVVQNYQVFEFSLNKEALNES